MSEKSYINITMKDDNISLESDLPIPEVNFVLDHIKYLIASGQIQSTTK